MRVDLAGNVDFVLDRHRHPQQRPILPRLDPRLSLLSFQQRLLSKDLPKRVQLRIKPSDPVQAQLNKLLRRNLPRPNHLRLPGSPGKGDVVSTHVEILCLARSRLWIAAALKAEVRNQLVEPAGEPP